VSRSVMIDAIGLVGTVFSGLSCWSTGVGDAGEVTCPGYGADTARVHGYHERTAADVPDSTLLPFAR
jgi:hypothetical protein